LTLTGFRSPVKSINRRLKDKENGRQKGIISVYWFQGDCSATNMRDMSLGTNLFDDIFDIYRIIKELLTHAAINDVV